MIYDSDYLFLKLTEKQIKDKDVDSFFNDSFNEEKTKILAEALSELRLLIGKAMKTDSLAFVMANGCSIYAGSKSTMNMESKTLDAKYEIIKSDLDAALKQDVETQLNSLNALKDYYSITERKQEKELIDSFIKEKKKELLDGFVCGIDYSKLVHHKVMMLKLRSYGVLQKTCFYTPNYDLAVEYILDDLRVEYNNGFSGFVNRVFNPSSFNSQRPNIVKIHGSLNWRINKNGQIAEMQPSFEEGLIKQSSIDESIIYPTSEKLFKTYNAPYSELLRFMLNNLQGKRNAVFVLGYKYGDTHLNDVLLRSISNPSNVFFFFDYDQDENCEFLKNIKELEKNLSNIHIISGKYMADFATFVDYLLPATPEKNDQEQIVELLQKVLPHGNN